jgi:AbrB family looped-hinge helix DNA binding protein
MSTTAISTKFQIVIPKGVRDRLQLYPHQRLHMVEKGGFITVVPELPPESLRDDLKGMSQPGFRDKRFACEGSRIHCSARGRDESRHGLAMGDAIRAEMMPDTI